MAPPGSSGFSLHRDRIEQAEACAPRVVWQLADSAFPVGGFAHSSGLEAARACGALHDAAALEALIATSLHAAARSQAPLALAVIDGGDPLTIDDLTDSWLTNHVANRASRAQGRALLVAAEAAFPDAGLASLHAKVRAADAPGHWWPMLGSVAKGLGCDRATTAELGLFLHLRSLISSAVRLGCLGPLAAQALQARIARGLPDAVAVACATGVDDLAQPAPLLDLWQGCHDRLYSRLFNS